MISFIESGDSFGQKILACIETIPTNVKGKKRLLKVGDGLASYFDRSSPPTRKYSPEINKEVFYYTSFYELIFLGWESIKKEASKTQVSESLPPSPGDALIFLVLLECLALENPSRRQQVAIYLDFFLQAVRKSGDGRSMRPKCRQFLALRNARKV